MASYHVLVSFSGSSAAPAFGATCVAGAEVSEHETPVEYVFEVRPDVLISREAATVREAVVTPINGRMYVP